MTVWLEWLGAALLCASGVLVLIAALGLWQLPNVFMRMHACALAPTLATWLVTVASVIVLSLRAAELAPQTLLIAILLSITAPVTAMLLARAALFRRRRVGDELPAPLSAPPAGRR